MISRIKGTQDFLDLKLFNFFIDKAKKQLVLYNFKEIATPIIEPIELFVRSVGEHTDIISKEMFTFQTKGEEIICLRPEATASTVRAFAQADQHEIVLPWKVFTYGPMFRYERPQKGRFRQFHQLDMEIIGSAAVAQDAQFIMMLDHFFRYVLQLPRYVLTVNYLGCPADRAEFIKNVVKFLDQHSQEICQTCQERKVKNPLRIFDCKQSNCQNLYKQAPRITDSLCALCAQEWQELKNELDLLSVAYVLDSQLVRGLDYYNKTVFEFIGMSLGAQNAFCGGGRYDHLVSLIGEKQDQPSIGAAIGIERILVLLQEVQDKFALPQDNALTVLIPMEKDQHVLALLLANDLVQHGVCIEVFFEDTSIKSKMRKANKIGAKFVVIIGPEEQQTQTALIKDMTTGQEKIVKQIDVKQELC